MWHHHYHPTAFYYSRGRESSGVSCPQNRPKSFMSQFITVHISVLEQYQIFGTLISRTWSCHHARGIIQTCSKFFYTPQTHVNMRHRVQQIVWMIVHSCYSPAHAPILKLYNCSEALVDVRKNGWGVFQLVLLDCYCCIWHILRPCAHRAG